MLLKLNMGVSRILKHPLFKGGIIYTITDAINKAVPFLILPLLTYYLTPGDYGIVSNYNVYTAILLVFVGLNLNGVISANFFHLTKQALAQYISNLLIILVAAFTIVLLCVFLFGGYIYTFLPISRFYLVIGVIIALAQMLTLFNMELWRLEERPLSFGVYQITQTILNFLLTILFVVYYKEKWEGRVWALSVASILYGLFSIWFIWKRGYLKIVFNKQSVRDALGFGLPLLPHALSIWVKTGIDRVFITRFYGTAENGLYATGFQFGLLMSFLTIAFNNAYIPYLYKNLAKPDNEQLKRKLVQFTYGYFIFMLVLSFIFTFMSNVVVDHFLQANYKMSKTYIGWAMLSQAFQGMYLMVVCYFFYAKRTGFLAWITFGSSLVQVGVSYFMVKNYGAIGAAYSTTVMTFITFLLVWVFSNKVYPMPWLLVRKKEGKF
jgi:O-antigen/teichoic acid export membrane protein